MGTAICLTLSCGVTGLAIFCLTKLPWAKLRLALDKGAIAVCKVCFDDLKSCCSRSFRWMKDSIFGKEKTSNPPSPRTMAKAECELKRGITNLTYSTQSTEASVIAVPSGTFDDDLRSFGTHTTASTLNTEYTQMTEASVENMDDNASQVVPSSPIPQAGEEITLSSAITVSKPIQEETVSEVDLYGVDTIDLQSDEEIQLNQKKDL